MVNCSCLLVIGIAMKLSCFSIDFWVRPILRDCFPFLSVSNFGVLLPNGFTDQDATGYGCVGLDPDDIVLDGYPDPPRSEA